MVNKTIAIPHQTRYIIPIKYLLKKLTNCYIISPSKNNLTLGNKYSPKDTSIKFKYSIGNYIEVLERGATILIQDYDEICPNEYNELQEIVLKKLGYNFKYINITKRNKISIFKFYHEIKKINNKINFFKYIYYIINFILMITIIDNLDILLKDNILNKEYSKEIEINIKDEINKDKISIYKLFKLYKHYKKESHNIKSKSNQVKILLIGDNYLLNICNFNDLEIKLEQENITIIRENNLTSIIFKKLFLIKNLFEKSKYLRYCNRLNEICSVTNIIKKIEKEISGIIHIKSSDSFNQNNLNNILDEISNDYKIPVINIEVSDDFSSSTIYRELELFKETLLLKISKNITEETNIDKNK